MDHQALAELVGRRLTDMRALRPLVHNVTNFVAMDISANALLAAGASPAMVHAPEEIVDFLALSQALVINIGTLSADWLESMDKAATVARALGTPWVLDPVGAGATPFRDAAVRRLLRHRPTVIRGNASEIIAVARGAGLTREAAAPKGVDGANTTDEALELARSLARHCFCTVAATGAVDIVTDGERMIRLGNGSALMARVTALGCALSAMIAAFAAVSPDAFEATVAAIAFFGIAGEMAAERANRPGGFRVALVDMLDAVEPADIAKRLRALP